jgi:flagellar hook-associated protein 2
MATVSSLGAGSGLDLSGLLTSLMAAEQRPLLALQSKEASYQARISSMGTLKSSLASLQTAASAMIPGYGLTAQDRFSSLSASLADTAIGSVSAAKGAVAGSYSLEVSSLAKNQRLASTSFAGAATAIGTGDLTIELGKLSGGVYTADSARSKTITIDSSNATLGGLRDAINAANIGASATIITGTGGAQLIISSKETGLSSVLKISGSGATPLAGFDYDPVADTGSLSQSALLGGQTASDAAFKLNGIAATSSSNSVTSALDGVTLNLTKTSAILTAASSGPPVVLETRTPTTLTVSKESTSILTSSLNAFIKAYNEANASIKTLGAYDAKTKAGGSLQGDTTLRTAKSTIQNLVFAASAGGTSAYQRLSDIGVTMGKKDSMGDNSLSLDSAKLTAAIAKDPAAVANLVAAVGAAFKKGTDSIVGSTGTIASAIEGANRTIKTLTKSQENMAKRLTAIEARYRKQFTALDTMVAAMKQTSSTLTGQLASLPGVVSTN